ncbi:eukaryotic long-chain fatty acid CoA synthetase (LC-FACS) [Lipomyces chichibuensis]|uniref:eukaryotic long-chain fatty acid CoA synthetase (LC-FACS) n=1 Tax=Lipomyces chichibuensis TaxID=1546026 RepID=UPI0033435C64
MAPHTVVPADEFHKAILRKSPPYSKESGIPAARNEVPARRNINSTPPGSSLRVFPADGIETTYDLIQWVAKKYGDKPALGSRKIIKIHEETKLIKKIVDGQETTVPKKWNYFELSPYAFVTYNELLDEVNVLGAALKFLKVSLLENYAATSAKWMTMALAASSQSIPIATAYDTLGEEGLTHSLVETEANAVFTDASLLPTLVRPLAKATKVQFVIYKDEPKESHIAAINEAHPSIKLISIEELYEFGKANPAPPNPPKREDLCCIMYTSGSTGTPKGVVLLHKNVIAAVSGADGAIDGAVNEQDYLLAYLPLAHILEFVFELACLFWGGTLGYGTIKTISDSSVRNCKGDIAEFRPTIMVGVPAVWETVRKGILSKVHAQGSAVSKVFWAAYHAKSFMQSWRIPGSGVLDSAIFKKVKEATGGRLRIVLNGGAAISKDTQQFISTVICPMIIGYGLTETAAMCTVMSPQQHTIGTVGAPTTCVDIKLVDVPENGYLSTNHPPQGEVLIKGEAVSNEYYLNEKETKAAFTEDGWFRTGDIGEWAPNGHLKLIDRKKNLVKTLNGEYIALEKVESIYRTCSIVGNICVYADADHVKPVAIIVPAEPAFLKLAKEKGLADKQLGELIHNAAFCKVVLDQLLDAGRKGGLAGIELICGVVIDDEEWTPQNGLVTAAQKLQRKKIFDANKKAVMQAFKNNS